MPSNPHVLFAGGGSLGHLYPGLAVAEHLRRRMASIQVTFAGSGSARERHAVRLAGHGYTAIPTHPVPRNPLQALRFVTDNVAGYCAARWMLREQRVSLIVGLGGSTSMAVIRAAVDRGIPVILFEQDAVPSRTTRWLSRAAVTVCAGFEEVRSHLLVQTPVTVTGNPSRTAFEELYAKVYGRGGASARAGSSPMTSQTVAPLATPQQEARRQRRLVILGGSAGARSLNEAIPIALKKLGSAVDSWQIVHQAGDGQLQETEARYAQLGVKALTVTHIDEAAAVLFASDLVVSRAGGTTLAELAMAGVASIVVPYPQAADNHQAANAKAFAAAGACRVVAEAPDARGLDAGLLRELEPLMTDHRARGELAANIQKAAKPQAASQIAAAVASQLCGGLTPIAAA